MRPYLENKTKPIWKSMPIVSTWAKLTKCVYINRVDNREGIKSINEAANNILKGHITISKHRVI